MRYLVAVICGAGAVLNSIDLLQYSPKADLSTLETWMIVNVIPEFASALLSGNIHNTTGIIFYIGVFLQWALLGYLGYVLFWRILHPPQAPQKQS